MSRERQAGKWILVAIVLALSLWGIMLAVGAYLGLWYEAPRGGSLRDLRRFWIVLGVVAAFLAFWGLALIFRARRLRARGRVEADLPSSDR